MTILGVAGLFWLLYIGIVYFGGTYFTTSCFDADTPCEDVTYFYDSTLVRK